MSETDRNRGGIAKNTALQTSCQVYWPVEIPLDQSGWLVGWNLLGFIACISCLIPVDAGDKSSAEVSKLVGD